MKSIDVKRGNVFRSVKFASGKELAGETFMGARFAESSAWGGTRVNTLRPGSGAASKSV